MSRTYKDKPSKLRFDLYMKDWILVEHDGFRKYRQGKTTKTKKRKEVDTEDHWMSTPSWWTKMTMIKPQRRECTLWEREVVKTQVTDLEEVDKPNVSRKPHIYYW